MFKDFAQYEEPIFFHKSIAPELSDNYFTSCFTSR
jgi:hypothetical protein